MPKEYPRKATYDRVQANPDLINNDITIAAEFEAAPWLLPPRTQVLAYAGVHDLLKLAELRAMPVQNWTQTVTVLLFSRQVAKLAQNAVYSLVKFGGIRNYLVTTWSDEDLQDCLDLNLPCADVSSFLAQPLENPKELTGHDYLVVKWMRPRVTFELVSRGFAVLYSDVDATYVMKPLWESFAAMFKRTRADAATQDISWGGTYVVLPTARSIALLGNLSSAAQEGISQGKDDVMFSYTEPFMAKVPVAYVSNTRQYNKVMEIPPVPAIVWRYPVGHYMATPDPGHICRDDAFLLDTCDWPLFSFHPPCAHYDGKIAVYKRQGVWFINDEDCRPAGTSQIVACPPLLWDRSAAEDIIYGCPKHGLAFPS